MNSSELAEFKGFWSRTRKWFNECNHNGKKGICKGMFREKTLYCEEHYEEMLIDVKTLGLKEALKGWGISRDTWFRIKRRQKEDKE